MPDINTLVQQIREYLAASHRKDTGSVFDDVDAMEMVEYTRMRELAEGYVAACHDINERAYRCQELLREGQWSQAMELAKSAPDLRTAAKAVDFRERGLWLDLCEENELPFPDIIDTDVVESVVEEVYGDKRTLRDLLRRHRRMAMGRAPLADRLRVLRKLCAADPATQAWKDDVQMYEAELVVQLSRQADGAHRRGNLEGLEGVLRELTTDQWMNRPGKKLLEMIRQLMEPLRQVRATQEYEVLLIELREAHAAMDERACRTVMSRWYQVRTTHGYGPSEDDGAEATPIEEWLAERQQAREEEEAYVLACRAVEMGIDESLRRDQLEKLAADVLRFERGMPEVLAARLASRMDELTRATRRRFAVTVGGVLLLAAGVAVGVTFWVMHYNRDQNVERWHAQIEAAIKGKDAHAAGQLLESLRGQDGDVYGDPEIQDLVAGREKLIQAEQMRIAEFAQCIAAVTKAGVATPDSASLAQAQNLARSIDEKEQVQAWREKIREYEAEAQRKRRQAIEQRMAELETAYSTVTASEASSTADLNVASATCLAAAAFVRTMAGITDQDKLRISSIEKSTRDLTDRVKDRTLRDGQIRRDLEQIVARVGEVDNLASSLDEFGRKYSDHPLATDFTKAAGFVKHWKAIEAWRKLGAGKWAGQIRVATRKDIVQRLPQLRDYLKAYGEGPCKDAAAKASSYLAAADEALQEDGLKNLDAVKLVIKRNVVLMNSMMMIAPGGLRYYLPAGFAPSPQKMNGVVTGYSVRIYSDTQGAIEATSIRVDGDDTGLQESPHTAYVSKTFKAMSAFTGPGWETLYLELAAMALEQTDMDPIIAGRMAKLFLQQAASCAPFGKDKIQKHVTALEDLDLDSVNWVDPRDAAAKGVRDKVKQNVPAAAVVRGLAADIQGELTHLDAELVSYTPVGLLAGTPRTVMLKEPSVGGVLYLIREGREKAASFVKVGRIADKKAILDPGSGVERDPCGSIVFFKSVQSPERKR